MKLTYSAAILPLLATTNAETFRLKRDVSVTLEDDFQTIQRNRRDVEWSEPGSGDPTPTTPREVADYENYDIPEESVAEVVVNFQNQNQEIEFIEEFNDIESEASQNFIADEQPKLLANIREQLSTQDYMWVDDDGVRITHLFAAGKVSDASRKRRDAENWVAYDFEVDVNYYAKDEEAGDDIGYLAEDVAQVFGGQGADEGIADDNGWEVTSISSPSTPTPSTPTTETQTPTTETQTPTTETQTPTETGSVQPNIPVCDGYPEGETGERTVTLSYINELGNKLADDIRSDDSKIVNLWEKRIIGSMFLSRDVLDWGSEWLDMFENMRNNAMYADGMASATKSAWTDSFVDCEEASCVTDKFCYAKTLMIPGCDDNSDLFDQVYHRCKNEAWRFNDFIMDGDMSHFTFSIVPMSSASCE